MMPHLPNSARLVLRFAKLAADRRGIAATEFAMLLPMMLVLFVGVTEVGQAIAISRKVTITGRTVTDLVSQYSALSTTDMTNLLSAAGQVMSPYPSSNVTVIVSEISTNSSSVATITWSVAQNGTAYTKGTQVTLPSGLSAPNISLVWGVVQYKYTPVFGDKIIGTQVLSDQIYLSPRLCTYINYPRPNSGASSTASAECCTSTSSCPS
jgi:Flp pilus assembly protein TadG